MKTSIKYHFFKNFEIEYELKEKRKQSWQINLAIQEMYSLKHQFELRNNPANCSINEMKNLHNQSLRKQSQSFLKIINVIP